MADADDQDIRHKLSEMEHRAHKRRRRAVVWTFIPFLSIAAIVLMSLFMVRSKQQQLRDEKQQAVAQMEQKKQQLDEEIGKSSEEIEQKRNEIAQLEAERKELSDYSNKLRDLLPKKDGIVEERGKIPDKLKASLQPRAKVTSRAGRTQAELYDVDLWIEIPRGNDSAIAGVTYDLDATYYKSNHFESDPKAPLAPVSFTVFGCESKVLITVTLKEPQGALTIDFDWCKNPEWPAGKMGIPVRIHRKGDTPTHTVGGAALPTPTPSPASMAPAPIEPQAEGRKLLIPRQSFDLPPKIRMPLKK